MSLVQYWKNNHDCREICAIFFPEIVRDDNRICSLFSFHTRMSPLVINRLNLNEARFTSSDKSFLSAYSVFFPRQCSLLQGSNQLGWGVFFLPWSLPFLFHILFSSGPFDPRSKQEGWSFRVFILVLTTKSVRLESVFLREA